MLVQPPGGSAQVLSVAPVLAWRCCRATRLKSTTYKSPAVQDARVQASRRVCRVACVPRAAGLHAAPNHGLTLLADQHKLPAYLRLWKRPGRWRAHRPAAPSSHQPQLSRRSKERCGWQIWQGGAPMGGCQVAASRSVHGRDVRHSPPARASLHQPAGPPSPRRALTRSPGPPTACGRLCQSWK